jgi:hypothetical protein
METAEVSLYAQKNRHKFLFPPEHEKKNLCRLIPLPFSYRRINHALTLSVKQLQYLQPLHHTHTQHFISHDITCSNFVNIVNKCT